MENKELEFVEIPVIGVCKDVAPKRTKQTEELQNILEEINLETVPTKEMKIATELANNEEDYSFKLMKVFSYGRIHERKQAENKLIDNSIIIKLYLDKVAGAELEEMPDNEVSIGDFYQALELASIKGQTFKQLEETFGQARYTAERDGYVNGFKDAVRLMTECKAGVIVG